MPQRSRSRPKHCRLPSPGSIAGRTSSITNAFFNALIPVHPPSEQEEMEALSILGMDAHDIRCAYCGDRSTEWDHLRPIITNQEPTGFITEIANLVPACGKCNQSKGKNPWRKWMVSSARLSPATRGIMDIDERVRRLEAYERWRKPVKVEFESLIEPHVWEQHKSNWRRVIELMRESQRLATEMRGSIERAIIQQTPDDSRLI